MSCRNWERGTIQLPSAAWTKFKADLRNGFNTARETDFKTMDKVVADVRALVKGKRGVDIRQTLWNEIYSEVRSMYGSKLKYRFETVDPNEVIDKLIVNGKLHQPKKKDFPLANSKTVTFEAGYEAGLVLADKARTAEWSVSENNHAVDRARETFVGRTFFALLSRIQWTRGSGGHIYGSDEYHEEAGKDRAGGGGSYIKETFGPVGDQAYQDQHGFSRLTGKVAKPRRIGRV